MSHSENRKDEDLDQSFLDDVLNQLYDFGDGPVSKRQNKSQKKKKRKRCEEEEEATDGDEDCGGRDSLDDEQSQDSPGTNNLDCSNTQRTGSANHQRQPPGVEVVVFQDPTKRLMTKTKRTAAPVELPEADPKSQLKDKQQPGSLEDLGLEKARLEVHRFGLTGYKKEQQRMFEQERAIMLGARPPKKDYVNYKVYQQKIKDKKEKAKEEVQTDLKKKKKKTRQWDEKRKSTPGGSAPTGQLGRFKNGMLVLNPKEIRKIKTSRVSK